MRTLPHQRQGTSPPRRQTHRARTPRPDQPAWDKLMATRRRKTLVVCTPCHDHIHAQQPPAPTTA
ncbi:MAG: hypothetical protein ACRDRD_13915 [Pseudonocardiaceae bacterium]